MKSYRSRYVSRVLRRLGLKPDGTGNGTDHEPWSNGSGRKCHPKLCRSEVPYAHLYCLGDELETQGICSRVKFLKAVKGRA